MDQPQLLDAHRAAVGYPAGPFLGGGQRRRLAGFYDDYGQTVLTAVSAQRREPTATCPPASTASPPGQAARGGFGEYETDQDWENEMLLWPTELLPRAIR